MGTQERINGNRRKTPSQARSRQRVELILESTRALLREQGLSAFTTTAIAEQAGIPVSSVYQYFPDKKAILVAIYEDYLSDIREIYAEFEDPKYEAMGSEQVVDKMFKAILQQETEDRIEDALEKAIHLYPELNEVDRRHRELTADIMADLFRRLGSRWSRPKLRRLSQFLYCVNAGLWTYRSEVKPPKKRATGLGAEPDADDVRQVLRITLRVSPLRNDGNVPRDGACSTLSSTVTQGRHHRESSIAMPIRHPLARRPTAAGPDGLRGIR